MFPNSNETAAIYTL